MNGSVQEMTKTFVDLLEQFITTTNEQTVQYKTNNDERNGYLSKLNHNYYKMQKVIKKFSHTIFNVDKILARLPPIPLHVYISLSFVF